MKSFHTPPPSKNGAPTPLILCLIPQQSLQVHQKYVNSFRFLEPNLPHPPSLHHQSPTTLLHTFVTKVNKNNSRRGLSTPPL